MSSAPFCRAILLALLLAACRSTTAAPDGGGSLDAAALDAAALDAPPADATSAPDAFVPSSALVLAADGGLVRSSDRVFTLIVPPGALAADTEISITVVPRAEWPADVAATSPIGELYDVQPDGLAFLVPAYAVHSYPTRPSALLAADGGHVLGVHRARSADGTTESVPTSTITHPDGVAVAGEITHLSTHWATATHEDGAQLSVRIMAEAGTHAVETSWPVQEVRFQANGGTATTFQLGLATQVRTASPDDYVVPSDSGEVTEGYALENVLTYIFGVAGTDERMLAGSGVSATPTSLPFAFPAPLPGWTCVAPGEMRARLLVLGHGDSPLHPQLVFAEVIGSPTCVEREEKPEYREAVMALGDARIAPLGVPATATRNLADTAGDFGHRFDVPAGATVRSCVTASMPTSILYLPRFPPGYTFVDGAPGCTDITNLDPVNPNTVLARLTGAGSPNDTTITTSVP